ncbi:MOSC domain-containing protein [Actinoplanes sp. NPDC020271]|uniref:MOSC domain-containing protein n=1 Tax=Actinoplanes sp. NPDC020271 TaxID=3363896 RepID=UPI0037A3C790
MTIGDVVLRVQFPAPRCIVPSLAQGDLPADPGLLRAGHHRRPVSGEGKAACFGVYADVVRPGTLRAGGVVRSSDVPPEARHHP